MVIEFASSLIGESFAIQEVTTYAKDTYPGRIIQCAGAPTKTLKNV
jgi:hypothetical protein